VPTDPTLRHLFAATPPPGTIDVAAVVRRSRARRLPKVLGVTGVSALAIGGLVFGGLQVAGGGFLASDAAGTSAETFELPADGAMSSEAADEVKRAPAENLNLCTATVASVNSRATNLTLSVDFADAAAGTATVEGTVTMTNIGTDVVTGYTAASPAITLARDGVVVWHSNGVAIELAREISLAPGESIEYAAAFAPVVCGVEDDRTGFRSDLPAAPPGTYEVSAAIDVMGEFDALLVTGPAETVTLH
jgi:hypothetical protein